MPAGIQVTHIGQQKRDCIVGQLLSETLAFKVTENGKPMADEWVTVDSDPEGAGVFPPSDESYASVQTDKAGIARVQFRPSREGKFTIRTTVRGGTNGIYHMVATRNVAQALGPNIVDARRGHSRSGGNYAWPIVAGLAVLAIAFLSWRAIEKPSTSSGAMPYPYPAPAPASTFDPDARAKAQAALAAVDAAKAELREETAQGLTENSSTDRLFATTLVRPVMRQAAITAREVRTLLASGSGLGGRPPICARDPSLAGCR
ncbi:MAG: hypothetical protein Q7S02_01560 [bacterium]|nr:hypothetical protein [bacterium]